MRRVALEMSDSEEEGEGKNAEGAAVVDEWD
jgi:hypothetical protein